jgi:hypothetical protein
MNKLQKVYIPTNNNKEDLAVCYFSSFEEWTHKENVKEIQAYIYNQEELKQLLSDYTNKILDNVETKEEVDYGLDEIYEYRVVDKDSITNQLNQFLKELKL